MLRICRGGWSKGARRRHFVFSLDFNFLVGSFGDPRAREDMGVTQSGALIQTPSSRDLIVKTTTTGSPVYENNHMVCRGLGLSEMPCVADGISASFQSSYTEDFLEDGTCWPGLYLMALEAHGI